MEKIKSKQDGILAWRIAQEEVSGDFGESSLSEEDRNPIGVGVGVSGSLLVTY